VTDDGEYTGSPVQIHATWTASDPDSGVLDYQYAVGIPLAGCVAAKDYADGTAVRLTSRIVTAVFADCFFVADGDRLGGLRVNLAGQTFALGTLVNVGGKLATGDGERALTNAYATP